METFEKVKKIVAQGLSCDEAEISMDSHLKDDLGADSLDAVDLIMSFEDEFSVSIPPEQAESLATVGDIVAAIEAMKA